MYEIEFHHDADEEMKAAYKSFDRIVLNPAVKLKFLSVVVAFRGAGHGISMLRLLSNDGLDISNEEYRREQSMKIKIVYKEEKGWFVGHIQEYPDYESQGKTLEELRENLIEIYDDISKGLATDAEPFQVLEVAI